MANTYKETMNLPKTDFAMKANLAQREPERLRQWQEKDVYRKVLEKNKDGEPFVLHDGPPYANGPIHIGHALNKTLKDIIVKYHAQRGHFAPYVPGWDCHGLPIENKVEDQLGPEKMKKIPTSTFRRICREYAEKQLDGQRDGFKRLGVNGEWDNPYLTFTPEYESANIEIFKKLYLQGAIYQGRKPIHWCTHCHTALAEAELEYSDEVSPAIFARFELTTTPRGLEAYEGKVDVAIWTTTPWTLPADDAVILHPKAEYVAVLHRGRPTLFARDLAGKCCEKFGWDMELARAADGSEWSATGEELCGNEYKQPIFGERGAVGKFIYADYVTLEDGTGIVHGAPGHGADDYNAGRKFGIDVVMPVADDGTFYEGEDLGSGGPFSGMEVNEANPHIIKWLSERGMLILHEDISHSYPHCWRCKSPVIFRATSQWFVSMEKTGLREKALEEIDENVKWVPAWAGNRIGAMVQERPDWCISRQRYWGVPIPVFFCKDCGHVVADEQTFDAVIELFRTRGADAWYRLEPSEFLPEGTCCPSCGGENLEGSKDVLDVWWESGVSHTGVCEARPYLHRPADLYLEGSDQHRGWFQSSLLTSVAAYGVAPYKTVVSCGFTVDEHGRKMSKSLGNVIDPIDIVNKFGADVLRLWVGSVDYSQDVAVSMNNFERISDSYRRIRNTLRFMLGALDDYDDRKHAVRDFSSLALADQWAMVRLAAVLSEVEEAYDEYQFHRVFRAVFDYCNTELSTLYLDQLKDRLYAEAPDSPLRRSAQTVVFNIVEVLARVISPILSFTAEEVWEKYPPLIRAREGREQSVQLAGWPSAESFVPGLPDEEERARIIADFEVVLEARDAVTKAIEEAREADLVKKSQEAEAAVKAPADALATLRKFDDAFYSEFFIVAGVTFEAGEDEGYVATVSRTQAEKCPRCWNYRELAGEVCPRCAEVLAR